MNRVVGITVAEYTKKADIFIDLIIRGDVKAPIP
jgi:hypothetical protein